MNYTDEWVRELPPLVPMRDTARALGLNYDTTIRKAKRGGLPVAVVAVGSRRFVRRSDLLEFLGLAQPVRLHVQGGTQFSAEHLGRAR